jgi:two-component system, LytTR family, response regulator
MENKIKAVLVDDENDSIEVLTYMLNKYAPEIEIVGRANNVEEAFVKIETLQPNLVFLDIQMPEQNGFSLLKKFENISFEVVFITSHNQYAINAIKFNALDYVLKPIDIEELKSTSLKAIEAVRKKNNTKQQIINLINHIEKQHDNLKIAVHKGDKVLMISVDQIIAVEAEGRYSNFTMIHNEKHTIAKNLKDIELYLYGNLNFIRISKSIIINVNFIKEYTKYSPYNIELINGNTYEIPRRKRTEILEKIKTINSNKQSFI